MILKAINCESHCQISIKSGACLRLLEASITDGYILLHGHEVSMHHSGCPIRLLPQLGLFDKRYNASPTLAVRYNNKG